MKLPFETNKINNFFNSEVQVIYYILLHTKLLM